jgi:hypothetical protein
MANSPAFMRKIGKEKGGRPKGLKNKITITREQALLEYKEKVCRVADQLFATQLTLAKGLNYLYKVEKKIEGKGKTTKVVKSKPMLVTDPKEMEEYLMGVVTNAPMDEEGNTYFLMAAGKPDPAVIDSMLDRTFGRATQSIAAKDEEGKDLPIVAINIMSMDNKPLKK